LRKAGPCPDTTEMATEREIKLPLSSELDKIRATLRKLHFRISKKRVFETNMLFDTADQKLGNQGELLRLRTEGDATVLTFKGPPKPGRHKNREELETRLDNAGAFLQILYRLDFLPGFRYEKFRTEFVQPGTPGIVMLDETPIGNFLEIEGGARWIDQTARAIGFASADYVTKSYGELYWEYCRMRGLTPANMVFGGKKKP
jgi:adenylate cyclase class 2